ncbi:hypothetical protein Vafri_2554, partial [Volvox africanus]
GGGGGVQSPTAREEEVKEDPAAAAALDGEGDDGDRGASEPEQLPTLSYLVNVQTLSDIRRAVREAHGDINAGGNDNDAAANVSGVTVPVGVETGTSPAVASASPRAGGSGGATTTTAAAALGVAAAAGGDLSLPLVAERSCSFSAVQTASSATSMSEISVRRGVSGIQGTDVWPGLEPHEGPPTDPRVVRESGGADTSGAANASISVSDAMPAAAMVAAAATMRRINGAECALQTARVGDLKESELTFTSPPNSAPPLELRAAGGKEVASGASSALAVPPRASVNTTASGGCDHSPLHSACVGVAAPEELLTLPQLHVTQHSPLPQTPTPGTMTTTITDAISAVGTGTGTAGSGGGGYSTPSSPPLPLPFNGFSAGQASGYQHQQQQQQQHGASSPSAGSTASSISLASPRLATADGSGTSVAQQSYGYTPSRGSLSLTPGSGPQFEMPPHHAHLRASPGGRQQPQLQPHPTPPRREPRTVAATGGGGGGGGGGGVLQRSTSASAATASASRVRSLSPPLPPSGASQLTPTSRAVSHDSRVSTPTSPSVGQIQIQIQDFLREPSTSSSLSPRALGSEFFRTPESAGTSNTESTTASVTSAGLGIGREINNFTTVSPATVGTVLSPSASASASTLVATGAQRSPDRRLLSYRASPGSSTTRPGFGVRKTSLDPHASAVTRANMSSPQTGRSSDVAPAAAAAAKQLHYAPHQHHQHQAQLVHSSREGSSALGYATSRRRRPSYEAEQSTKAAQKAAGVSGGGASPGVSGGGAALNPLYSGAHALAVLGGGHPAEQQTSEQSAIRVSGGAEASRGGQGATAGRGSKLHSARGGSSNRNYSATGRAVWH